MARAARHDVRAVALPRPRERITNWSDFATSANGALRYKVGRHPDRPPPLTALVHELRDGDTDVDRWWDDHRVTFRTSKTKHVAHPEAGPLSSRRPGRVRRLDLLNQPASCR